MVPALESYVKDPKDVLKLDNLKVDEWFLCWYRCRVNIYIDTSSLGIKSC